MNQRKILFLFSEYENSMSVLRLSTPQKSYKKNLQKDYNKGVISRHY